MYICQCGGWKTTSGVCPPLFRDWISHWPGSFQLNYAGQQAPDLPVSASSVSATLMFCLFVCLKTKVSLCSFPWLAWSSLKLTFLCSQSAGECRDKTSSLPSSPRLPFSPHSSPSFLLFLPLGSHVAQASLQLTL